MYRLPNGKIITNLDRSRFFTIGDVNHPEVNLLYWDDATRYALGIQDVIIEKFDSRYFEKNGPDTEILENNGNTVRIRPVIKPKFTPANLAKAIGKNVKIILMDGYKQTRPIYDELNDADSPTFDDTDPLVNTIKTYWGDLKLTKQQIKDELKAIIAGPGTDPEKYQLLIDYDFNQHIPDLPDLSSYEALSA